MCDIHHFTEQQSKWSVEFLLFCRLLINTHTQLCSPISLPQIRPLVSFITPTKILFESTVSLKAIPDVTPTYKSHSQNSDQISLASTRKRHTGRVMRPTGWGSNYFEGQPRNVIIKPVNSWHCWKRKQKDVSARMGWGPCPKAESVQLPAPPFPWVSECFCFKFLFLSPTLLCQTNQLFWKFPAQLTVILATAMQISLNMRICPIYSFSNWRLLWPLKQKNCFLCWQVCYTKKKGKEIILRER